MTTDDRSQNPGYHRRGCPQHVHPSQRDAGAIAICTCGGINPDDRGLAALAERLPGPLTRWGQRIEPRHWNVTEKQMALDLAAVILGTDGVFLPDGPGTNGERCRAIEAAARAIVGQTWRDASEPLFEWAAQRGRTAMISLSVQIRFGSGRPLAPRVPSRRKYRCASATARPLRAMYWTSWLRVQ